MKNLKIKKDFELVNYVNLPPAKGTLFCKICSETFETRTRLQQHLIKNHEKEPFVCNLCGKSFLFRERLKLHMRIHTGEKPYKCEQCHKGFARCGQLVAHNRTHSDEKFFSCSICDLKFKHSSALSAHTKRHFGIKLFQCDICNKEFARRDSLKKHVTAVHTNLKPYQCPICKKNYKSPVRQDHLNIHKNAKPFKCELCDAAFVQKSQLRVHTRVHTGFRPYECKECGQAFSHSTALILHTRRHSGEKPFKCLICPDVTFRQLPHYKKHMRTIHKKTNPYLCITCKTFFKYKVDLTAHEEKCKADEVIKTGKCTIATQTDFILDENEDLFLKLSDINEEIVWDNENEDFPFKINEDIFSLESLEANEITNNIRSTNTGHINNLIYELDDNTNTDDLESAVSTKETINALDNNLMTNFDKTTSLQEMNSDDYYLGQNCINDTLTEETSILINNESEFISTVLAKDKSVLGTVKSYNTFLGKNIILKDHIPNTSLADKKLILVIKKQNSQVMNNNKPLKGNTLNRSKDREALN